MALYQYSTLFFDNDMMSRLEADEPDSFTFDNTPHRISAWHIYGRRILNLPVVRRLITSHLPASGARSMWIDAPSVEIPEGEVAEISVNSSPGGVLVSLASADSDFESMNTIQGTPHAWFDTRDDDGYIFAEGSRVPKVFVTLVNPSLTTGVNATVSVGIRDPDAEVEFTSHVDGDTVNNRVVSIAGSISPEIRGDADRVVVTANGIDTVAQVSADGTFAADVVVALGDNLVEGPRVPGCDPHFRGGGVESSRGREQFTAAEMRFSPHGSRWCCVGTRRRTTWTCTPLRATERSGTAISRKGAEASTMTILPATAPRSSPIGPPTPAST